MDARREYERRTASNERSEAYALQRSKQASERFTRDDVGMAYGTDGAMERAASLLLTDAGYQWNGSEPRTDDDVALGGFDVLPDSLCHIDGAPSTDASTGTFTTIAGYIYATDNLPAMMRERPDGNTRAHNKFVWRNVDSVMVSDTLGRMNPRLARLGGRNRRDGRDLVRTALAVGVDGATLRTLRGPSTRVYPVYGPQTETDDAYAYALETAHAMRTARLAHYREVSKATHEATRTGVRKQSRERRAIVDAHVISADLTALLARVRAGTSEYRA